MCQRRLHGYISLGRRFRYAAERDGNVIPAPTIPGRTKPGQLARPSGAAGKTMISSDLLQRFE